MSKSPLPDLGGKLAPDPDRQETARRVMFTVDQLLLHICEVENPGTPVGDGGPMLAGAIGGVVKFALRSGIDDQNLRANIMENVDLMIGQLRMDQQSAGARAGRA